MLDARSCDHHFLHCYFLSLVQPVSVTAIQTSVASAWRCFSSRAGVAEVCVRSVATTRPDATASTARTDTPATTASRWTTARPANVSHLMCVCVWDRVLFVCWCVLYASDCAFLENEKQIILWETVFMSDGLNVSLCVCTCPLCLHLSVQKCLWGGYIVRVNSYSC